MLRLLTAGESHGKAIVSILEGMPAGLKINLEFINNELKRRQAGFGRGKRMQIENDRAQILSGLKNGATLGSPITLLTQNKDSSIEKLHKVLCPRPGHADLAGLLKYGFTDIREVLERASARATAGTVGVGGFCKIFLNEFKIIIASRVLSVGGEYSEASMKAKISEAIKNKDTIGGIFEVAIKGAPVGLGSYVQPDRRLDGRLAQALMSIPGVKAVEIGLGLGYGVSFGSEVHDEIFYSKGRGYFRKTNNAGGIEGGISNGGNIILRGCMKPICTLMNPLESVQINTKRPSKAAVERSDTSVVAACGVVAEAACAFIMADAMLEKFGCDNLSDIKLAYLNYMKRVSGD
jgi:chorismate synthase